MHGLMCIYFLVLTALGKTRFDGTIFFRNIDHTHLSQKFTSKYHLRIYKRKINVEYFQIALDAFGDRFELELNRNLNLVPNQRPLNIFYADKDKEDIHYMASNEQVIFVS